jgi:hypothetical protein
MLKEGMKCSSIIFITFTALQFHNNSKASNMKRIPGYLHSHIYISWNGVRNIEEFYRRGDRWQNISL